MLSCSTVNAKHPVRSMYFEYVQLDSFRLKFSKFDKQQCQSDVCEKYDWSISEDLFLQFAEQAA